MYIKNGFIVQRKPNNCGYKGVENDNWYLNHMDCNEYFKKYYDEHIEFSWNSNEFVDCCNNIDFIIDYIKESIKKNINCRVILCETKRQYPRLPDNLNLNAEFIGFDYAYSGGSYYSTINNDTCLNEILETKRITLNDNGLFDTENDLTEYVKARNEFMKKNPNVYLEDGDFIEYKLSLIKL